MKPGSVGSAVDVAGVDVVVGEVVLVLVAVVVAAANVDDVAVAVGDLDALDVEAGDVVAAAVVDSAAADDPAAVVRVGLAVTVGALANGRPSTTTGPAAGSQAPSAPIVGNANGPIGPPRRPASLASDVGNGAADRSPSG